MILTVQHVTEHLERGHNILASAPVFAANIFANSQAYQEENIILLEFDEKNAAIEHMEKNKMATLQILSQKDLRIEAENLELKVCVEAQQTQLNSVTKSVEAVKCKVLVERKSLKT